MQARREILSTGEVQEGKGSGVLRGQDWADDGKRAKTRRVARWTLVRTRREIFINWGESEGGVCRGGSVIQTWRISSDAALTWEFHVELFTCVNVGLFGLNVDFPR